MPDTKKVIEKLNKGKEALKKSSKSIFEDEGDEDNRDDPFFNDDINARDTEVLKTSISKSTPTLATILPPATKSVVSQDPAKPPKSKPNVANGSDQGSARLPQINKRF